MFGDQIALDEKSKKKLEANIKKYVEDEKKLLEDLDLNYNVIVRFPKKITFRQGLALRRIVKSGATFDKDFNLTK